MDTDDDDPSVTTEEEDTAEKWSDAEEEACGTLPWSSLSQPEDADGDGICDAIDEDVDGQRVERHLPMPVRGARRFGTGTREGLRIPLD